MGVCSSRASIIVSANGNEADYYSKYLEDRGIIGKGEFGSVKLVHDMESDRQFASKIMSKGMTFKDNTLYTPLSAEMLQRECDILRTLEGLHFTMKLYNVFESRSKIWLVTEYCSGGHMNHWVSHSFDGKELRTDTVSRVAFQMLDAVSHCHKHGIMHRDIKPENIMFCDDSPESDLRLIDYGSGHLDMTKEKDLTGEEENELQTTFAGSPFYISPEMFKKAYNEKTDIWSVGITLYVLVAGFPAGLLQKAFDMLQTKKNSEKLRELPQMPEGLPDSFFEMMKDCLCYDFKQRKDAQSIQQCEFVKFYAHESEISVEDVLKDAGDIQTNGSYSNRMSAPIKGSVFRHTAYLDYQKFERSVTTILATMFKPKEFVDFILILEKDVARSSSHGEGFENRKKLGMVTVEHLNRKLLELERDDIVQTIKLKGAKKYDKFSYNIELLRLFAYDACNSSVQVLQDKEGNITTNVIAHKKTTRQESNSVHGNNVWLSWKKKKNSQVSMSFRTAYDIDRSTKST